MDVNLLVGSWKSESDDSTIELHADGTYLRVSSFVLPMTYETIALDDQGTFAVGQDSLTFTPTSGHYVKNGVDEGFDPKVRQQQAQLDSTGTSLVLDGFAWSRRP